MRLHTHIDFAFGFGFVIGAKVAHAEAVMSSTQISNAGLKGVCASVCVRATLKSHTGVAS